MLHRNLQKRLKGEINLEGENRAHPSYQEENIVLRDTAELDVYSSEMDALMSTKAILESVVTAKENLESAGVSEETITESLAPTAIAAIESVDSTTAEEAELSLESGNGSFWDKIKATAKRIWDAIVAVVKKMLGWITGFFKTKKSTVKQETKVLEEAIKDLSNNVLPTMEDVKDKEDEIKSLSTPESKEEETAPVETPAKKQIYKISRQFSVNLVPHYLPSDSEKIKNYDKHTVGVSAKCEEYLSKVDEFAYYIKGLLKDLDAQNTIDKVEAYPAKEIYDEVYDKRKLFMEEVVAKFRLGVAFRPTYSQDEITLYREDLVCFLKGAKEINSKIIHLIGSYEKTVKGIEDIFRGEGIIGIKLFRGYGLDEDFDGSAEHVKTVGKLMVAMNHSVESIGSSIRNNGLPYLAATPDRILLLTKRWIKEAKKQLAEA